MSEKKELTPRQRKVLKQKECFARSETLKEAFFMANRGISAHRRFVHYTTLSRVVQILTSRRWWLTRSDSDRLNDVQEAKKYGNSRLLKRMYQASFAYGSAESAAMWGLYCPGDPLGVMISIDGKAMRDWFAKIRSKEIKFCLEYDRVTAKHGRHVELTRRQIDIADARDVIYASTDFSDVAHRGKGRKNRSKKLFWFDTSTDKIENLEQEIADDKYTGWLKDSEWRQENESRIAVRVKNVNEDLPDHLSVNIPDSVLRSMLFTLSPWFDEKLYGEVADMILALVTKVHEKKPSKKIVFQSVITGALESWRGRYRGNMKDGAEG